MKTTWNIIKTEQRDAPSLNITTPWKCFNKYFLSVAEDIIHDTKRT
jgi:hypothetical protein